MNKTICREAIYPHKKIPCDPKTLGDATNMNMSLIEATPSTNPITAHQPLIGPVGYALGLCAWVMFLGIVCNLLTNAFRQVSWHDKREIIATAVIKNGVAEASPWHKSISRVTQIPLMVPTHPRSYSPEQINALAEQWASESAEGIHSHTTASLVAPDVQELEVKEFEYSGGELSTEDVQIIQKLVWEGGEPGGMNEIAKALNATKNSKRYHAVREVRNRAVDARGRAELASKSYRRKLTPKRKSL